jgi:hypothetical protein
MNGSSKIVSAGGPFKPFFGLSGDVLRRKLAFYVLGTETISRVRADSLCDLLLLPTSSLVHDTHPQAGGPS